jgi:hypothetical protein
MSGLPPGTPIVLFCLDNTSFLAATEEGGMIPISKCVTGDQGYHVNGALVVAPERALQGSVEQLKRIVDEFSDFDLFIVTLVTRYVSRPCCKNSGHVSNFGDPDFLASIISDLTKLKFQLRKKLQPATVQDGIELVCGAGCGREKVEQTLTAGWASDPVYPASHVYAKMALNLIEKVALPSAKPDTRKRKRSEDSGSGGGAGSQSSSGQANPRIGHSGGQPRAVWRLRIQIRIWVRWLRTCEHQELLSVSQLKSVQGTSRLCIKQGCVRIRLLQQSQQSELPGVPRRRRR